jgi:hypothetical protein
MATFPFTFPHAGRTFSVVTNGVGPEATAGVGAAAPEIFVRIVGIRGLHEFGRAEPSESNGRLMERIRRWYDQTYLPDARSDVPGGAPS